MAEDGRVRPWRAAVLGVVLVVIGVIAVLVGEPRADETIPTLAPPVAGDTFGVPGPIDGRPLGHDPTSRWTTVGGEWLVRDGEAGPTSTGPSLALVEPRVEASAVGATVTKIRAGAGVVVGHTDDRNYVVVAAAPAIGTWIATQLHDGKRRQLGTIGLSSVANGDRITVTWTTHEVCAWVESIQHTSRITCFDARGVD